MALKAKPETTAPLAAQSPAPDIDIESMIADELLENIDWSKVKSALFQKVSAKFFAWLASGDQPVVISAYPELQGEQNG